MTDRLEEPTIRMERDGITGFTYYRLDPDSHDRYRDGVGKLEAEVERLTHLHNLDHSLADQWQAKNEKLEAEVERLRGSHDTMTVDCQTQGCREKSCHELMDKQEAEIKRLRGELGEAKLIAVGRAKVIVDQDTTIATLRITLNENTEIMFDAAKKIATLRQALEEIVRYSDDRISVAKAEKALAMEAPQ